MMQTLFRVESSDIERLNPLQLTKLLKMLLNLEAKTHGIAENAAKVALNINVPDGGEDGRIKWKEGPESTNYLPSRFVLFQCKAEKKRSPKGYADEITGKDGKLKNMVEKALDAGGAYIVFTTRELNAQQTESTEEIKKGIITAIRERLTELGKSYADEVEIDIYDASMIEGWVNKYIPTIVAVLSWQRKYIPLGLKTWDELGQYEGHIDFEFSPDQHRVDIIKDLREIFKKDRVSARIIGLSGLGKTRLVYEAFKNSDNSPIELENLNSRVVYLKAEKDSEITDWASACIRNDLEGVIVVDDCDYRLHDKLRQEIKRMDSKVSLLTLDNNFEKSDERNIFHLKRLPAENIRKILEPEYGPAIKQLGKIIEFAQGFPQIAVLLAKARLKEDPKIGSLTDDVLAEKILWGKNGPKRNEEKILRACSLFDKFGFEDEAKAEREFIAKEIAGVCSDDFYACVKKFKERGLFDKRGRFLQFIPKPLAIRLASQWWNLSPPEKLKEIIFWELPGTLIESFCTQISFLDFLPEAKTFTEELCGVQGPFGQAEMILSNRGSRLFRAFSEVNPEVTSNALSRVLENLNEQELKDIKGDTRRNLVWALEKLCFHKECFLDSSRSLLLLGSQENESYSNNAAGIFTGLFHTFLSGTEAPPDMRLEIIDQALEDERDSVRGLAVEALGNALEAIHYMRSGGAENQGIREPLEDWRPVVWQEAFDYWDEALSRLCELVVRDDQFAPKAKASIAGNIRGLMLKGRVDSLDKVIKKIVEHDGPVWLEALNAIKTSKSFDSKQMPADGKAKLESWISLLTPTDLKDRIFQIVNMPSYEHDKLDDGEYEDVAATNASAFAREMVTDTNLLIPFVDDLLTGEQRQAYNFGKTLVEAGGDWKRLLPELIKKIKTHDNPNLNIISGILNGIFSLDQTEWESRVHTFYETEELNKYYPRIIVSGEVSTEQLDRVIELLHQSKTELFIVGILTSGRPLEHLSSNDVAGFVEALAGLSNDAAWTALDILSMYCYGKPGKFTECKETFGDITTGLKLEESKTDQGPLKIYHWKASAEKLLKIGVESVPSDLTQQIISGCLNGLDYSDLWHSVQPILKIILKNHAKEVWPLISKAIKKAELEQRFELVHLLEGRSSFEKRKNPSLLAELPSELFEDWCLNEPTAPRFAAQATDVLIEVSEDKLAISSRAQFLIDNFGEDKKVLSSLSSNMFSYGWTGSRVPHLQKEIDVLTPLKTHEKRSVRNWARAILDSLSKEFTQETQRDEEQDWGIF